MIARPPVERVGDRPIQISSKLRMWAASSTIRSDRASDRPASSDVGMALIDEPLENSISCLLLAVIWVRRSHLGRLVMIVLTFLIRFCAVFCLVAIMRIDL